MQIALLAPRDPIPIYSGLMERIYQLGETLGADHDVTLYYPDEPSQRSTDGRTPETCRFERVGIQNPLLSTLDSVVPSYSALRGLYKTHPWLYPTLRSKLREADPDAVVVEMPYLAPVALAAARGLDAPVVLSEHNVEYTLAERLDIGGAGLLKPFETTVANSVDTVVTVSEADRRTLDRDVRTPIRVAPNGVDVNRYAPAAADRAVTYDTDGPVIVYHGNLGNAQNGDAVERLVESLLPEIRRIHPEATLVLVGPNPPELDIDGVQVTGLIDDLPAHIARADLALVPLRAGSGTKLKILEYLAAGTPVVTTTVGAEGLPLVDGKHAIIRETDSELVAATDRLLSEPSAGKDLARNGRELAETEFAWGQTLKPYRELLAGLVERGEHVD
ncbi:glycosyltransferase family 4 protein [Halorhabdus sp. CUG00001]|uniref:glycosyltransferase family 4 protein n=1 Tax=Halorhabdus sp. CUG00001 TaxID=2600297 RepID=UPI00131AEEEE|nr:glycosyltransferase family 4 protein [Halorhabdus sp. CUG00001]